MCKRQVCNLLTVFVLLLFLISYSSLGFAREAIQNEIYSEQPVNIKVTLKDFAKKPLAGVRVKFSNTGNEDYQIEPICNPDAPKVAPGISDQNGTAYFRLIAPEPGALTLIATAERVTEKPPLLVSLIKNVWYTFFKTEVLRIENLDLLGSVEFKIKVN